jgi:uncharacterized protein YccT (UPF0319 family)
MTSKNETLAITGRGQQVTVNNTNKTNLTISGVANTINIESNLGTLNLSGGNNLLAFAANITVDSCNISGNDNIVQKSGPLTMTCNDNGLGNVGF